MAESKCGKMSITPQSSKIPDFLAAVMGSYSNIQQAGMNLSYLQDQTNMAATCRHGNQKSGYNHPVHHQHQEEKRSKMAAPCRHGNQKPGYDHPLYHHLHPAEWTGYHSYSALSQCLPIDQNQDAAGTFNPDRPDFGRCSTPDIIQSVLQMDPHDVSPIGKQQTPANHSATENERSPMTSLNASIWRSPGGREYMDSGYLSEDSLSSFSSVFHTKPEKEQAQQIPAFTSSFFQAVSQPKPADLKHQKPVKAARRLHKYTITSSHTTSSVPSFKYDQISPVQVAGVSSEGSPTPSTQIKNVSPVHIQSSQVSTSIEDTVQRNSLKRKLSETDMQPKCSDVKRGRHNEPLNNLAIAVMTSWYNDNMDNPYPNKEEKEKMAREGGIKVSQVKSWFANKRNRSNNTRPKVQKQQLQERLLTICQTLTKDQGPVMDNSFIIQQLSTLISSAQR